MRRLLPDFLRPGAIPLPLPRALIWLLVAAFLVPGLAGHDLWKFDDAVDIGIAFNFHHSGDWLIPRLASEPWLEDGPLYFWVAALTGRLFGFALPFHDGARIASALFVLVALWFVRLASRELYGEREANLSLLALLGALGLTFHAHEALAETSLLAGSAITYYGLAIAWKKPWKAATFFALGESVAFLAQGLLGVLPPLIAAIVLLPLAVVHRTRSYLIAVGVGALALLPLAGLWPALLAWKAPDIAAAWWTGQFVNITQPFTFAKLGYYLKTLCWAAWPLWPLTLWATWEYRRRLRDPGYAVPVVAVLVTLVMLLFTASPREVDTLLLLVPLAVPTGAAAIGLRRGAANALASFGTMTFGLIAVALWVMWFAMMTGVPRDIAYNVLKLAPGFTPAFSPFALIVALVYTAGWIVLIRGSERSTLRSLTHWAAGVTLVWGLAATLWMPWGDNVQTYRPVAEALKKVLPPSGTCVASVNLSEASRAVFDYHAGLVTEREELGRGAECSYLLAQLRSEWHPSGPGWELVWEGQRPRDHEWFRLYRREH